MAWRFRKSVKIASGVRLNFSQSGVSTTIGGKGFSVNTSSKGTYVNRSIPGTGIYSREKVGGGKSKKASKGSSSASGKAGSGAGSQAGGSGAASADEAAAREYCRLTGESCMDVSISLDDAGTYTFRDSAGNSITDPDVIALVKKTSAYKEEFQRLKREQRASVARKVEESEAESAVFTSMHEHAAGVWTAGEYQEALDSLEPLHCEPAPFEEQPPTAEDVSREVAEEAEREVQTHAFWKVRKLKEQYCEEHFQERYDQRMADWQNRKLAFELRESEAAARRNAELQEEYEQDRAMLLNALEGSPEYIEGAAEDWLSHCDLPVAISAQFEYRPDAGDFLLDLDLPEIEDLPQDTAQQLKSGNLKVKPKTQTALRAEYARCVFGTAVYVVSNIFNISSRIGRVLVSGYTQRRDKVGELVDDYIFSIWFEREGFYDVDYSSMDPEEFCMSFRNRCNATKTKVFKTIVPYEG